MFTALYAFMCVLGMVEYRAQKMAPFKGPIPVSKNESVWVSTLVGTNMSPIRKMSFPVYK